MVVRERFEHLNGLGAVILDAVRRGLRGPTHHDLVGVALVERIPILVVPGIVESLHELQVAFFVRHFIASLLGSFRADLLRSVESSVPAHMPISSTSSRIIAKSSAPRALQATPALAQTH